MTVFRPFIISLCVCCVCFPALARQSLTVNAESGDPLFRFDIFDRGETGPDGEVSTWTLGADHIHSIRFAADYWSALLGGLPKNSVPAVISILTYDEENDDASSAALNDGYSELAGAVLNDTRADGSQASSHIGYLSGYDSPDYYGPVTLLPENGKPGHLGVTMAHELGHAMGIIASASDAPLSSSIDEAAFADWDAGEAASAWTKHLYDSWGKQAESGQKITLNLSITDSGDGSFQIYYPGLSSSGHVYFGGANVTEVLRGTALENTPDGTPLVNLVPISGAEYDDDDNAWKAELSHIELRNSMMSHQSYRNWGTFMEAELAILQDIGIQLDRSRFFGYSIYQSNRTESVDSSTFAWSQTRCNPTPWAVGLHLYGDNNIVTMSANALSSGFASAGIRVDGTRNALTIAPQAVIAATGPQSSALMVAYGTNHNIIMRGSLLGTGNGGYGARFDFGSNMLGNHTQYHGSYIYTEEGDNAPIPGDLLPYLNGPLVKDFDVTGTVAGGKAAIYISENALVKNINIMNGAGLYGDIISDWDPDNAFVQPLPLGEDGRTSLSFGLLADSDGRNLGVADSAFHLAWRGDIRGPAGIVWSNLGGVLEWGGRAGVHSFFQRAGSTLLVDASVGGAIEAADSIELEPGAGVGVRTGWFSYGAALPGEYAVLTLSDGSLNSARAIDSRGGFSKGFYDYAYSNVRWSADGARLLADTVNLGVNETRAGKMAISAPFAMAMQNPSTSSLRAQQAIRFALKRAGLAPGELGRNIAGEDEPNAAQDNAYLRLITAAGPQMRLGAGTAWAAPSFSYSKKYSGRGFAIKTPAVMLGFDFWLNDSVMAGLAVSTAFARFTSAPADIDGDNVTLTPYAGFLLPHGFELGVFASYGYTDIEQRRHVADETYHASYSSDILTAGLSLARSFDLADTLRLRPFVNYEHIHITTGGYTESAGTYSLRVGSGNTGSHRLDAGAGLEWRPADNSLLAFSAWYSGLYGDRRSSGNVFFTLDAARDTIKSTGYSLDEHALGLGLNLGLQLTDSLSLGGGYSFTGGKEHLGHQASLKLEYNF